MYKSHKTPSLGGLFTFFLFLTNYNINRYAYFSISVTGCLDGKNQLKKQQKIAKKIIV